MRDNSQLRETARALDACRTHVLLCFSACVKSWSQFYLCLYKTAENSGSIATVLAVPSSAEPAEAQDFRQKLGLTR
jgi:hypothetical protein